MCKILTSSGRVIDPFDFQPADVRVKDIAHAQSNIARWNGGLILHMPLAQHSVIVSQLVQGTPMTQLAALFHDADEYILSDISSPLKKHPMFAPYRELAKVVRSVIFDAVGIGFYDAEAIRVADNIAVAWECRDLTTRPDFVTAEGIPKKRLVPWSPSTAKVRFLQQYTRLRKLCQETSDDASCPLANAG